MLKKPLLSCLILLLLQFTALSQEGGTISIVLHDQNGDLITTGIVSVIDKQGNKVADIELSKSEVSTIINLNFGNYILEVQSPSFKPYKKEIEVTGRLKKLRLNLKLKISMSM